MMKTLTKNMTVRALLVSVFGLVFGLYGGTAFATITGSDHDMSGDAYGTTEICAVCHTPHNAVEFTAGPLWDRELTISSFTLYTSPLGTLNAGALAQPAGASKLCLGCHDGTVAMENFGGITGAGTLMQTINPLRNFGTDLSNDHPISFLYNDSVVGGDTGLNAEGTIPAGWLISGSVECASCHDVHNNAGGAPFLLRASNTVPASGLCLTCHNK